MAVRVFQRADALEDNFHHLADRQQARHVGVRLERRAGHVFHDEIAAAGLDHGVEDLDDVRVGELAGKRRFGDERLVLHALLLAVGVLVEQKHLDGDIALGERVAREIDLARRTGADLAQQRILADVLLELELHARARAAICCKSSASW